MKYEKNGFMLNQLSFVKLMLILQKLNFFSSPLVTTQCHLLNKDLFIMIIVSLIKEN